MILSVTSFPLISFLIPLRISATELCNIRFVKTFRETDGAPGINSSQSEIHSIFSIQDSGRPAEAVSRIKRFSKCFFRRSIHDRNSEPTGELRDDTRCFPRPVAENGCCGKNIDSFTIERESEGRRLSVEGKRCNCGVIVADSGVTKVSGYDRLGLTSQLVGILWRGIKVQ